MPSGPPPCPPGPPLSPGRPLKRPPGGPPSSGELPPQALERKPAAATAATITSTRLAFVINLKYTGLKPLEQSFQKIA